MAKSTSTRTTNAKNPGRKDRNHTSVQRLMPPENGVTVRMYRTGHGDCFLLAFAGEKPDKPVYVLIDCGYKPGSPKFIHTSMVEITKNIREATGGMIDIAIITHEHQDHVNGINKANFDGITIGELWLAWTEDPEDHIGTLLRETYQDKLLGLLAARRQLAAAGQAFTDVGADDQQSKHIAVQVKRVDKILEFELGGDDDDRFDTSDDNALLGIAKDPSKSKNKGSMKLLKDLARNGVKFITPHKEILTIPGAKNLRVFALGPPRNPDLLTDLQPREKEAFQRISFTSPSTYFAAAASMDKTSLDRTAVPFDERYSIVLDKALDTKNALDSDDGRFFRKYYGQDAVLSSYASDKARKTDSEVHENPAWRRIDNDWLFAAEQLALDMSDYTNNASLVLAFELGKGGKVLLFAADAQRGNWHSWALNDWLDGDNRVTAKDLLARTVLYKVGHHGSHNATLMGLADNDSANLEWMGQGDYGSEFVAMITAVRAWAEKQNGWDHPLPSIKAALMKKANGRVFQTDTDFANMGTPSGKVTVDWKRFASRVVNHPLYFDYTITSD